MASLARNPRLLAALVVIVTIAAACSGSRSRTTSARPSTTTTSTSTTSTTMAPPHGIRITSVAAPAGFSTPRGRWIAIARPDGITQLAVVFRPPTRSGPFPVAVFLHGSSGLPKLALEWAPRLASAGFVVLAGCYLSADPRVSPQVFLPCPGVPDDLRAAPSASAAGVSTLVDAATALPGVRRGRVTEVAISLGANLALSIDDPRVRAIAADSGHRTVPGTTSAPVLLLGMTTDPNVPHPLVVAFEQVQAAAGKPVDSHYYAGTGHVTIFGPPTVADDATSRIVAFLRALAG